MKRRVLSLGMALLLMIAVLPLSVYAADGVEIDEANFPDSLFRSYISENFDTDGDAFLSPDEIAAVTSMDLSDTQVADLQGIEKFPLINLDVSGCTSLEYLGLRYMYLESLDASGCTALAGLTFNEAYMKNLNVSRCGLLTYLTGASVLIDPMESLNVSGCTSLRSLYLGSHQLASLDVSGCTSLWRLQCNDTRLTDLDVSGCPALEELNCFNNDLLTDLNVKGCTALTNLYFSNNRLSSLDVSGCTALRDLRCKYEPLESLNISGTAMTSLHSDQLPLTLTYLNAANCLELGYVNINRTSLSVLDVSGCTALGKLDCIDSQLSSLNINGCTVLWELMCYNSRLTDLDVSGSSALTKLNCGGDSLIDLNVNGCTTLKELGCSNSRLSSLDISDCTSLEVVFCVYNNDMTDLNASGCTSLQSLNLATPQLSSLNVSGCTALTRLVCVDSQLSSLDLSQNTALETLYCSNNQLSSLNLSQNTALETLYCDNNQLSSLDLSQNTALETLYCDNNHLNSLDLDKEIKDLSAEAQISNLGIQKTSDGWTADLAKLVGEENLNKVEIKPEQGWQYDATAGTASYIGENMPVELIYYYNGNNFPTASMDVTVTLFESQKIRPCVVMKQGAEQAYVNGFVAPTTRYAAGYAKAENISGTMQMPLRYIAEVNGFTVDYDADTENIKVTNPSDGTYLLIILGNNIVTKHASDGTLIASSDIPLAFTVHNGVTVGPLRFTCEALGLAVSYQETAHGIYVVISQEVQTDENALAKIEEAYQLGL